MEALFIGQIIAFGGNFAPRQWAFCEGQLLAISSNTALFSILGTTYGGDGRTTFALPDLRGRQAIGDGRGPGLIDQRLGEKGGAEQTYLTLNDMPSHNHTSSISIGPDANLSDIATNNRLATEARGGNDVPEIYTSDAGTGNMAQDSVAIGHTGNNQPFNNRDPFLASKFIIALFGPYPSRS